MICQPISYSFKNLVSVTSSLLFSIVLIEELQSRAENGEGHFEFSRELALASRGKTSPAQKQLRRLLLHLPINLIKVIALHLFRWSVIFVRWSVQRKVIRISKDLNFHPGQTPNISWQDYRLLPRDSQLPTADKHWEIKWKVLVGECCILICHITLMVYLWKGLTWPRHRPTRTNINLAYWTPET